MVSGKKYAGSNRCLWYVWNVEMKLEMGVKAFVRVRVHLRSYILIIDDTAYWQYQ